MIVENSASERGKLLVFEGADRSGKTTQTIRCVQALRNAGFKVAQDCPWRFPDRSTAVGKLIDAYLKDKAELNDQVLHLLFSANRWEKAEKIREALRRGETVILDRYAYSGVAYSSAKGIPLDWCKASDTGLPMPDSVIYLDLPLEKAAVRSDFGKERFEREGMQRRVTEQFRRLRDDSWVVVDADAEEDIVFERVMSEVRKTLRSTPRRTDALWCS